MKLVRQLRYRLLWLRCLLQVLASSVSLKIDANVAVQRARRRSERGRLPGNAAEWSEIALLGHAVSTAGSWVVDARKPCLPIALATQKLLSRRGYRVQLCFGVYRKGAAIDGHAWVECAGRCVVGRPSPGIVAMQPPGASPRG